MADLFLFRSPVGHIFILISRRTHTYIDFLICDTELRHILILISRRTHTYAYLPSDIYLCLSLEGHILIQISQRTYIELILILVLRILYLYYRAYTCISDLIIVLQSLFLYFRSYTCITELILVFKILYLYSRTYSCISDLIAYRSMRDHIHPPRVSAPSCIIPPVEDVAVRPYLVPLLPTFHGMENENSYTHIRDFEEVCITFKEGAIDMDLLKLKAFPLTLKDKAKIWLNSLRPRTIRSWAELQAEFLKKFFSAHKTNNLKRQIYTFAAHDNERFYQCWERFMETISACPHHGFDTWMLVNHFYGGMSLAMKQLLETMCGGDFLSKHPDEAMDFLNYVVETSKGWDEPNPREVDKMRPSAHQRGGIFALSEDMEMKARISTLARKVEELEGKRLHEVQAVTENPAQTNPCINCQSTVHSEEHCPIAPSVKDLMSEHANAVGQYKP